VLSFKTFVKLSLAIMVPLTAFMARMFAMLAMLIGLALFTLPVFPALVAVIDFDDIVRRGYGDGRALHSRSRSATQRKCGDRKCETKTC
jgi:hypothetical protein